MADSELATAPEDDESYSIFHLFPKLPIELQVKIWKAACLPSSNADCGIHYVTVDVVEENKEDEEEFENSVVFDENLEGYDDELEIESDDTGYVTLRAVKRIQEKPNTSQQPVLNTSAYLWDAGLWSACKESRHVITEHFDIDGWNKLREQPFDMDTDQPGWYHKSFPSTIVPRSKKDEEWRPIVIPARDIFCIDNSKLKPLSPSLFGMKLLAPFLGTRKFTIMERWNIAFKFDIRWNQAPPHTVRRLKRENSPRGLLANWVEIFADDITAPNLWIIDDNVRWVARAGQVFDTVYRDCGRDYVQVDWSATRSGKASGEKGAVYDFMTYFGALCDQEDMYDLIGMGLSPVPFETSDYIRLLVRRENELPADGSGNEA
ncbi:tetracycline resistance [Fusarium beomiforme]|uniref:Tetracycline resistance n=1 Tax=Fusarium beomiforme TaxID=44412 RepID=A0A9P5DXU9_9HYPO|nr:tetracycline resistance [Fusarium beomiforme]